MGEQRSTAMTRDLLETAYGGAASGDISATMACLHPDVVLQEAPGLPFGGEYRGPEGIARLYNTVGNWMDLTCLEVVTLVADGEWGLALLKIPTVDGGHPMTVIELWQVRDEKLWRCRVFIYDQSVLLQPAG